MKKVYEEIHIRIELDEKEEGITQREIYERRGYKTNSYIIDDENGDYYLLVAKKEVD